MVRSSIYIGKVSHMRKGEVENTFTYPLNMFAIDLDELPTLHETLPSFGYNKFNLLAIWDKDYLTEGSLPIKKKLLDLLEKEGCGDNIHQIILLTTPRYVNYVFNPMSTYYCFTKEGSLRCCLVEVNNTFGDKHVYVVDNPISKPTEEVIGHFQITKGFHVSPFYDLKGEYEFKFSDIRDNLLITFDMKGENTLFHAKLKGEEKLPLTQSNLVKTSLKYPFTAWMTMPRILWQAAKLYLIKKVPFYSRPIPFDKNTIRQSSSSLTLSEKIGRKVINSYLHSIKHGQLTVKYPDGFIAKFGDGTGPEYQMSILNNSFFTKGLWGGEVGFGESFVDHDWEVNDLAGFLTFLGQHASPKLSIAELPKKVIDVLRHYLRKNSIAQAKKNIEDHYDINNDMFFLFLDRRKLYSSGIYRNDEETLEQAQLNKINALIEKAHIQPIDHVLEIGFGWGGFAIEAVKKTGCTLTGITLSNNQLTYAQQLVKQEGLEDKITLKHQDYRDVQGHYDKIVSVEMLEAVGDEYLPTFFKKCAEVLKPGGLCAIQTIIYPDSIYDKYKKESDWIKKHIFPGGHLPSLKRIENIVKSDTDFHILSIEKMGKSYAKTLAEWRLNFEKNKKALMELGFDEAFFRKWVYYFSYCEAGFRMGLIDVYQILLKKDSID